jgi:hypothetical protein
MVAAKVAQICASQGEAADKLSVSRRSVRHVADDSVKLNQFNGNFRRAKLFLGISQKRASCTT